MARPPRPPGGRQAQPDDAADTIDPRAAEARFERQLLALPLNAIMVVKDTAAVASGRDILQRNARNPNEIQFVVPNERTAGKLAGNALVIDIADDVDAPELRKLIESRAPRA